MNPSKRILIAPLDWGLGHAARCVPIINELIKRDCEVFVASSGRAIELLRKEFPTLPFFDIEGYNPTYATGTSMVLSMALQVPKFLRVMVKEQGQIEKIVSRNKIDVVISDNRYGCYSKHVKSIFITHQLNIQMPAWLKWFEKSLNQRNEKLIQKFAECWVPATEISFIPTLLKHSDELKVRYIGYLSRLEKKEEEIKYEVCALCSGPEPQRTYFDKMITAHLKKMGIPSMVVRGKTETPNKYFNKDQTCTIANYLTSSDLNEVLNQSKIIVARSGYSTVMDLAKLGKKAIFIPTPGQTEQEYLAHELMKLGVAYSMKQNEFDLRKALDESTKYRGFQNFLNDETLLSKAIDSIL